MYRNIIHKAFIGALLMGSIIMAGGRPALFTGVVEQRPNIADLAAALSPTVVYIESKGVQRNMPNDPFHFFFRDQGEPRPQTGAGSGVIVSGEGHIITNYHVIENADEIQVTLNDERVFDAEIIGTDPEIDMAVLKIEAPGLTFASLGDSTQLRVGEWVVAIGAPLGYRYTVTLGIISALNRGGSVGLNNIENYIQTDAAINRGNSGGPLIDMGGNVIGINTAISAMGQNIGFAVPINLIKASYYQIVEKGTVSRGALGVQIRSLDAEAKEFYGTTHGALVASVTEGSPAERGGIVAGDLITKIDGQKVRDSGHLVSMIAVKQPGEAIKVTRLRKGQEENLTLTLGDRSEIVAGTPAPAGAPPRAEEAAPDYTLENVGLTLTYREEDNGWVISKVESGSPAAEKGLRPGWKVRSLNQSPLRKNTNSDLFSDLSESKDVLLIEIENSRGTQLVFLKPS